ncbi:MAG: response regulator [Legionellaceae bacterium]|nr:response regulator [Legionellaceae bacterium]
MDKKILVIDDSATARMLFKVCLQAIEGYELIQASTWQDALEIAKKEDLELVVFDYNMPDKVGPEVAVMMRDAGVKAPFALMTANTQDHVIEEVEDLGFIHVMEKPVSAEMVQIMLDKL